MDLIAKRKFRYRGRALTVDQSFTATRAHGRVLVATGRAREPELGTVTAPRPRPAIKSETRQGPAPELQAARAEYRRVTGKRYFTGWDVPELRARQAKFLADREGD